MLTPTRLRCEHLNNPVGVDRLDPRLGWIVESAQRDQHQSAYQVRVATSILLLEKNEPDLWDSGRVDSNETIDTPYDGRPLVSHDRCFWQVRVWDRDDIASDWSEPVTWVVGMLAQSDWQGEWIGDDRPRQADPVPRPTPYGDAKWIWGSGLHEEQSGPVKWHFRTEIELPADLKIKSAEVWANGDAFYDLSVNGIVVVETLSTPDGERRTQYTSVDTLLRPGINVVSATVTHDTGDQKPAGIIARLHIVTADDQQFEVVTNASWSCTQDPGTVLSQWKSAKEVASNGEGPRGELIWEPIIASSPRYLRREFCCDKTIQHATLYTTALGINDVYLNGSRVCENYFDPGWTDYNQRVHYRAHDVSELLREGGNAVGVILADGWYSGYIGWGHKRDHYGKYLRTRINIVIQYEDGTQENISTNSDWKASTGPTLSADFLKGEVYDARLASRLIGWDEPNYDDNEWFDVVVGSLEVQPKLDWHPGPPVVAIQEFRPVSVNRINDGVYVFDLGQNIAGVPRLKINGRPGQVIQIRFAERLNPNGTLYQTNLRSANSIDRFICSGGSVETWSPRYTFHGFQYVEVTGLDDEPTPDMITGIALSSDTPIAGSFKCSDDMINQLSSNIYWTQRMNFIDVPTDCPQRDERLGWTGDAQVYISTATLKCDVQAFFDKWLLDLIDAQREDGQFPMVAPLKIAEDDGGPAWSEAGVICPWVAYWVYGDVGLLKRQYESIHRFIAFCQQRSLNGVLPPKQYQCFGDWLNIGDDTPHDVIYTAYYAHSVQLASQIAQVLERPNDAKEYAKLFKGIKAAFNKTYVGADGRINGDTQTGYALAICYDLLDGDRLDQAAKHLVRLIQERDTRLSTGFVGTKDLLLALAKIGRNDLAYQLLHNTEFPSWGFSIVNGATTIWERWDGWTPAKGFQIPGMNSFAHYSFGAVFHWMVENIGGIRTATPAYKHIVVAPQPGDRIESAEVEYDSVRGLIASRWRIESDRLDIEVQIPANTTAEVHLPTTDPAGITEGAHALSETEDIYSVDLRDDLAIIKLGSGTYRFSAPWVPAAGISD